MVKGKYKKKPEHNAENYLKAILESMEFYNAYERADIASWLKIGFEKSDGYLKGKETKKALALEIISKWIQLFEDIAIVCLMLAGNKIMYKGRTLVDKTKEAYEVYDYVSNQTMLEFCYLCRKGLTKNVIASIYGFKTARELLKEKIISKKRILIF